MGLGVSVSLIAAGAIVTWAVTATASGVDVYAVAVVLLVAGVVGVALTMIVWSGWAGPGYLTRRRTTYVDDRPPY